METEPEAGAIAPMEDESRVEGFEPKEMTRAARSLPVITGHSGSKDGLQIQIFGGPVQVNAGEWGRAMSAVAGSVIGVTGLDNPAQATYQKSPVYPHRLRREGVEGVVEVSFVVDQSGRVETAKAMKFGHREHARAAESAVRNWRFNPGTKNGRAVKFKMSVPIVFSISEA